MMTKISASVKLLVLHSFLSQLINILEVYGENVRQRYYLRHYYGKCLEYDATHQVFIFTTVCREKFSWSSGAKIIHIPTSKCLDVNSTADGSFLTLSTQCSKTSNLFQYDEQRRNIIHLMSGKCLHPESSNIPPSSDRVVIKSGCSLQTNKYWFRPTAHYKIRHFSGLCWKYDATDHQIKLQNSHCDRFHYENDYRLKHINTGKCVSQTESHLLILTSNCKSKNSNYKLNKFSNIEVSAGHCIQPKSNRENPLGETMVTNEGCSDRDHMRFKFYDERDILEVELLSESCDDIASEDCFAAKGHITVNGAQHSLDRRGINIVLFDYRSGLFEHRSSYDVFVARENTNLQQFLDTLKGEKLLLMVVKEGVNFQEGAAKALQKHGVSATYATTNLPKARSSLANIAYTGQGRKVWEKSINRVGGTGASVIVKTIMPFRELNGRDDCSQELGAQNGLIPDSAFTAASSWDTNHLPFRARAQTNSAGWCSGIGSPISDYIQVDLGTVKIVTGVAIQGQGGAGNGVHYVTEFNLLYSTDDASWKIYTESGNNAKAFDGVRRQERLETRINWFQRKMARYLRIIPTTRSTKISTCIRLEFYGCLPEQTIFTIDNLKQAQPFTPYKHHNSRFSVYSLVKEPSKMTFGISNAADNKSLAVDTQQVHFYEMDISSRLSYGKKIKDPVKREKIRNKSTHFITSEFYEIGVTQPSYIWLGIKISYRVLDAKQPNGKCWGVLSLQKDDQISIISYPQHFKRHSVDKSLLSLNVQEIGQRELAERETVQLDVSLSHIIYDSHSNAYNIGIFIYYDSNFFHLTSLKFQDSSVGFRVLPSKNQTSLGKIHIHTDELRLMNSHSASIEFKTIFPAGIAKGGRCNGSILVDFTYMDNLDRFNGKVLNTINKEIPYKCKIQNVKDVLLRPFRLSAPQLSMLYDEINGEFFFCFLRKIYATRNASYCYRQLNDSKAWHTVYHIASLKGIDATTRELYGVDRQATVYIRSLHPFNQGFQIEDSQWEKADSNPNVRKPVIANDISSLPLSPSEGMIISISNQQVWAATKSGIWKKSGGQWDRVVML